MGEEGRVEYVRVCNSKHANTFYLPDLLVS
jgi:hypothetical protein